MSDDDWSVLGVKDAQLVRSDWTDANAVAIDGVTARLVTNVLTDNGYLTEIWRDEWDVPGRPVRHIFQRVVEPGPPGDWHAHAHTTDRLFCAFGRLAVALYDSRRRSATHGAVATYRVGAHRPALITVPPGVWHAVKNIGSTPALFVNAVDDPYHYEDPDHRRLPAGSPEIPFSF